MIKMPSFKGAKINFDNHLYTTITILVLIGMGMITWVSILGISIGRLAAVGAFLRTLLGRGSAFVPFFFFVGAAALIRHQAKTQREPASDTNEGATARTIWGLIGIMIGIVGIFTMYFRVTKLGEIGTNDKQGFGGGVLGLIFAGFFSMIFGDLGSYLIFIGMIVIGCFVISGATFVEFMIGLHAMIKNPSLIWDKVPNLFSFLDETESEEDEIPLVNKPIINEEKPSDNVPLFHDNDFKPMVENAGFIDIEPKVVKTKPVFTYASSDGNVSEMVAQDQYIQEDVAKLGKDWVLPSFDLLSDKKNKSMAGDLEGNKGIIKKTLDNFGITVTMSDVSVGPTVSQYTLQPAEGVRLSSIDALQRDLALALAATNIRIEAPGKKLVGIEIPNFKKETVRLRDLIQTQEFLHYQDDLPIGIGKDVTGQNMLYPLSKMPHLLVAGATGSGKSVWINGLLLSLIYRYSRDQLGLILVDMKRVELKLYEGIPHLLSPVITDQEKAVNALKWTVLEMDRRYKQLEESSKRNIKDYNKYAKTYSKTPMKYIVFVIDELGDLMMLAKNEVEPIIVRLTQMSRAVGIHIVLGTQRPDTQVVTGLIKANIPTRIAFAVASQIDSRVILDQTGAEKLLGQGDGLIVTPSTIGGKRFQGALVEESEVKKVVSFLKDQVRDIIDDTNYDSSVILKPQVKLNVPGMSSNKSDDYEEGGDNSYENAKKLVIQYQKASTSFLQNKMGIGYPKAAKIIMQLEENGFVGPANGSKPRDVYIKNEEMED
jgi:DNA segregation ATPase FtsK/SpoIIIE, S-DNA-T family